MKPNRTVFLILISFFLITACGNNEPEGSSKPKPLVELAPDFSLENLDGGQVSLSDLKGSPIFLNFWASWCRPCRAEMPDIDKIHEVYGKKGLKVFAINSREKNKIVEKFRKNTGISVPILLDKTGSITKQYKVFGLPVSFFIDKEGKVAASIMGQMDYQDMDIQVNKIL